MPKYKVIIEPNIKDVPEEHEISAALVISREKHCDVRFILPSGFRTPDFDINGTRWELKSPIGSSSRTIENNLRSARGQSPNIILDLRRIKMPMKRALDRINDYLSRDHKIKRLVVIDKNHKVIDIL